MPEKIGSYRIDRILGAGGMGTVYLAQHELTDQIVALKVLPASMAREAGFVARFEREIDALTRVQSPHIVELYGHGSDGDTHFYAMEFIDGMTIADLIRQNKRLDWKLTVQYSIQICQALKAAHDAGVIHRDLKPSNLMVGPDGQIKLTDFGVARIFASAKLTKTGGILGTAEYMSPEQAKGQRITAASDIYSLGAVMFAMITGRPPFTGDSAIDIIRKHQLQLPDRAKSYVAQIPHWLDDVIYDCLKKDPKDRPATAYMLGRTLASIPEKVSLSQSEVTWAGQLDSSQKTMVTKEPGHSLGATFVRDLLRGELYDLNRIPSYLRPMENMWVLMGLLLVCIGAIIYFLPSSAQTPQEKFEQGLALFERGEPYWLEARDKYFLPLKKEDLIAYEDKLIPYLQEIDRYDIRRKYGFRDRSSLTGQSESHLQSLLTIAGEYYQMGDYERAGQIISNVQTLTAGEPDLQELELACEELMRSLPQPNISAQERKLIQNRHLQIQELVKQGRLDEAKQIWESVRTIYGAAEAPETLLQLSEPQHDKTSSTTE